MKQNDKGFTLIELVVVIALMAVALTVSGMALSNLTLANTKRCAGQIQSYMESVRMESLKTSEEERLTLAIFKDENDHIMIKVGSGEAEEIASSAVRIQYVDTNGNSYELADSVLTFKFDRGSGAFKEMSAKKIIVSGAGREYVITCYSKTGKVTVE